MFQILKILHLLGHRLTFLPDNLADIPPYGDGLRKHGIEVIHHPYVNSVREFLQSHGPDFDTIILSRCDFARKYIQDVRRFAPQSYIIFDTVDLHFLRTYREANLRLDSGVESEAREKEQAELELVDQTNETWAVSEAEADLLRSKRPSGRFEVVSNVVDVPGSATAFSLRRDFLFIGSFQHPPNIDAVIWFTREILPGIRERLNNVQFYIIGDKAPPEVIALANQDVIVTGMQPNVGLYFDNVRLSVAPLRYGAGVKGKINQSMGYGVPVVATSMAADGMRLTNRENVMIADEPEAFAQGVIELYESEDLWNCISSNGIRQTDLHYSVEAARRQLHRLFGESRESTSMSPK